MSERWVVSPASTSSRKFKVFIHLPCSLNTCSRYSPASSARTRLNLSEPSAVIPQRLWAHMVMLVITDSIRLGRVHLTSLTSRRSMFVRLECSVTASPLCTLTMTVAAAAVKGQGSREQVTPLSASVTFIFKNHFVSNHSSSSSSSSALSRPR